MLRILSEKSKAKAEIKILGRAAKLPAHKLPHIRLHARAIVRDRNRVFIGSQSLRTLELDARREVGVIFRDVKSANLITETFMKDWELAAPKQIREALEEPIQTRRIAKKVAKAMTKELPMVAEILDLAVKEVAGDSVEVPLNHDQLQDAVKRAVKETVVGIVHDVTDVEAQKQS
jgi:cardiolipin synthase